MWSSPALSEDTISMFKSRLEKFGYSPSDVLPHANYFINLGNPDL
jgi:AP endonuclease-1